MKNLQVTNTLTTKASEIEDYIKKLELALKQARVDLAHVKAAALLMEAPPEGTQFPLTFNIGRLYRVREIGKLIQEALVANGPMSSVDLTTYCIRAKGFDTADQHLHRSVSLRVASTMHTQERRGKVKRVGKAGKMHNAIVWALS